MKTEAQKKINKILADVWGVEFEEQEQPQAEEDMIQEHHNTTPEFDL